MADTFAAAMQLMRKRDPQLMEDGFALMRSIASSHLPELVTAYESESDMGLRRWLLELIASTGRPEILAVLVEALRTEDEVLRYWAETGLATIDTKDARTALYDYRSNS